MFEENWNIFMKNCIRKIIKIKIINICIKRILNVKARIKVT